MTDQLMTEESFARYRRHCESKGYCEPFVPYVGDQYGQPGHVKLVYCGGAAAWREDEAKTPDDVAAFGETLAKYKKFAEDGVLDSPFWRLFNDIADRTPGLSGSTAVDRLARFAWTNLSKAGVKGKSAPPNGDKALRALDVQQFKHEMSVLQPDLLVCVSGSLVISTGYAVFQASDWEILKEYKPKTKQTLVGRSQWGGWLYWTMHPMFKPSSWRETVLDDVQAILAEIAKEKAVLPG